ncbi:MAG: MXAN_5187 C-terminal domain-containing protein [Sandaracinus sp.]
MTPQEFEQLLHDGEIKLARLKALYEQWFQGIEKLEPSVVRKDLERHFELLKKNLPRNTALRFRTQQLVARYSTYGIYWSRVARQIEEGTFKRDLVKVAKRRGGMREKPREQAWELDVDVELDETEPIEEEKTDPGLVATAVPARPGAGAPSQPAKTGLSFDDDDLDAILGTLSSQPPEAQKPKPSRSISPFGFGRPAPGTVSAPPTAMSAPAAPAAMPTPAAGSVARPTPAAGAPAASATFGKPKDKAAPASSLVQPLGGAAAPATSPSSATTTGPHAAFGAARPATPAAGPAPTIAKPAAAVVPKPGAPAVPRPAVPAPAVAKPVVPPPAPAHPAVATAPRPVPAPTPAAIPRPAAAPVAAKPAPAPAPAVARPAPAPTPAAAAPRPAPAASGGNLDDRQMRAIYDRYVDARRQNNERTDVRFETLAESVQKMIPKLREKHGNKAIDFDVVVQNGKVGLKPKVGS